MEILQILFSVDPTTFLIASLFIFKSRNTSRCVPTISISEISPMATKISATFKASEATRPAWDDEHVFTLRQTKRPNWTWGDGASDQGASLEKNHIGIDPQDPARTIISNYKLLVSGIIPRPVGFVSTISKDGKHPNLAPISYFTVVNHDPPVFVLGFEGGLDKMKDSLRNILDTEECVINIISEHMIEAANVTSINSPFGFNEWTLSGLTPAKCTNVLAARVQESIFSIEGKLMETKEFESVKIPGKKGGAMAIIQGTWFWVREDALNDDASAIKPEILRPMSRLGGMQYGCLTTGIELLRPVFGQDFRDEDLEKLSK